MTEQPDTAAIRTVLNGMSDAPVSFYAHRAQNRALCDALDAARAELNEKSTLLRGAYSDLFTTADRAEAAEAKLARCDAKNMRDYLVAVNRADAAEARIAAALIRLDADPLQTGLREDVRRALTGGTE